MKQLHLRTKRRLASGAHRVGGGGEHGEERLRFSGSGRDELMVMRASAAAVVVEAGNDRGGWRTSDVDMVDRRRGWVGPRPGDVLEGVVDGWM